MKIRKFTENWKNKKYKNYKIYETFENKKQDITEKSGVTEIRRRLQRCQKNFSPKL